jgi:outer membrane receptor protein involved in Fe transport
MGERCDYSTTVTTNGVTSLKYGDQHAIYYQPETITDYELGYRGTIMPGVKIDTNLFYYDYKNLQLSAIIPINGANQTVTTNAGKASVLGWEFETQLTPAKGVNLTLGVDLTDGHYRQFCPSGLTARAGAPPTHRVRSPIMPGKSWIARPQPCSMPTPPTRSLWVRAKWLPRWARATPRPIR